MIGAMRKLIDLDATLSAQQHIVRFDASVSDGLTVQVAKSLARLGNNLSECGVGIRRAQADLYKNARDLVFLQCVVFDCQSTTFHVFHYDPQLVVPDQIRIKEIRDVGALQFHRNQYLVDDDRQVPCVAGSRGPSP